MKVAILTALFSFAVLTGQAQEVKALPAGKYETYLSNNSKWDKGDIVLVDDNHYKLSSSQETGDYHFSATAQRLFFTSGPLKGVFARTKLSNNKPAIMIPLAENQQLGLRTVAADVVGRFNN